MTAIYVQRFSYMSKNICRRALKGIEASKPTDKFTGLCLLLCFCSVRGTPSLPPLPPSPRASFLFVPYLLHSPMIRVNEDINPAVYTFPFFWSVWLQRGKGQIGPLSLLFSCSLFSGPSFFQPGRVRGGVGVWARGRQRQTRQYQQVSLQWDHICSLVESCSLLRWLFSNTKWS